MIEVKSITTPEEIRDMVAAQRAFTPQQRRIIDGAIEVSARRLRDVLRPRPEVFTLDADQACREASAELARSGHSRAPVCTEPVLSWPRVQTTVV